MHDKLAVKLYKETLGNNQYEEIKKLAEEYPHIITEKNTPEWSTNTYTFRDGSKIILRDTGYQKVVELESQNEQTNI